MSKASLGFWRDDCRPHRLGPERSASSGSLVGHLRNPLIEAEFTYPARLARGKGKAPGLVVPCRSVRIGGRFSGLIGPTCLRESVCGALTGCERLPVRGARPWAATTMTGWVSRLTTCRRQGALPALGTAAWNEVAIKPTAGRDGPGAPPWDLPGPVGYRRSENGSARKSSDCSAMLKSEPPTGGQIFWRWVSARASVRASSEG